MKDIKMSDVFFGEVERVGLELIDSEDSGSWASFHGIENAEAAAYAINSHDSLVEQLAIAKAEIAELTNSIKLVLEWGYDSSDAIEAIEEIITEQLAKHKGE